MNSMKNQDVLRIPVTVSPCSGPQCRVDRPEPVPVGFKDHPKEVWRRVFGRPNGPAFADLKITYLRATNTTMTVSLLLCHHSPRGLPMGCVP